MTRERAEGVFASAAMSTAAVTRFHAATLSQPLEGVEVRRIVRAWCA
jgi:hypothetical protein